MKLAGIDLGTTSLSGVLFDLDADETIWSGSVPSGAETAPQQSWENRQDAGKIVGQARRMLFEMQSGGNRADAICVTGQMHGILYVDAQGKAISPLYTWLDRRGGLPFGDGKSYAEKASSLSGHPLSTGFGLVTHFYNSRNGLVPAGARRICTVMDYAAMQLAGETAPVTDPSNAAGLGAYLPERQSFDHDALERLGIDPSILPEVAQGGELVRRAPDGMMVAGTVGDNQASFLGAIRDPASSVLLNLGTSGQISMFRETPGRVAGLDTRPFPEGFLMVGATLSGGKSLALLADFYRSVIELSGCGAETDIYGMMNRIVTREPGNEEGPTVDTRFAGSRRDGQVAGGRIENITLRNFTPARLTAGFMDGMAHELHELFVRFPQEARRDHPTFVGSGNTVRNNPAVRARLGRVFGSDAILVPQHAEEAAFGAALLASLRSGATRNIREAMSHVTYDNCC